jgi:hypothetical protein
VASFATRDLNASDSDIHSISITPRSKLLVLRLELVTCRVSLLNATVGCINNFGGLITFEVTQVVILKSWQMKKVVDIVFDGLAILPTYNEDIGGHKADGSLLDICPTLGFCVAKAEVPLNGLL